jgi:hypothetical protein
MFGRNSHHDSPRRIKHLHETDLLLFILGNQRHRQYRIEPALRFCIVEDFAASPDGYRGGRHPGPGAGDSHRDTIVAPTAATRGRCLLAVSQTFPSRHT